MSDFVRRTVANQRHNAPPNLNASLSAANFVRCLGPFLINDRRFEASRSGHQALQATMEPDESGNFKQDRSRLRTRDLWRLVDVRWTPPNAGSVPSPFNVVTILLTGSLFTTCQHHISIDMRQHDLFPLIDASVVDLMNLHRVAWHLTIEHASYVYISDPRSRGRQPARISNSGLHGPQAIGSPKDAVSYLGAFESLSSSGNHVGYILSIC
jgi:hypothetical protein